MIGFQKCYNMKIEDFKDFIMGVFIIIDDLYSEYIADKIKYRKNKDLAILSDSESIAISRATFDNWFRKGIALVHWEEWKRVVS